jgi:hypothetical protein
MPVSLWALHATVVPTSGRWIQVKTDMGELHTGGGFGGSDLSTSVYS